MLIQQKERKEGRERERETERREGGIERDRERRKEGRERKREIHHTYQ